MYLDIACRACLILVFAVAAFGKLRSRTGYREFAASLRPLGAERAAPAVAAAEVAIVILLLFPFGWGYALGFGLLGVFIGGIALALRSRQPVACNCFGAGGSQLDRTHLVRNGLLALIAVTGFAAERLTDLRLDSPVLAGIAATGGAVVSLIFIRWDDLAFLLAPE
jgi:hypothetical protein